VNPHGVGQPTGPVDLAAVAAWTAQQDRTRVEHDLNPHTHHIVQGPCITGCGRPTRNHSGICRTCTVAKNKHQEKP
jgi:hypothetical protein